MNYRYAQPADYTVVAQIHAKSWQKNYANDLDSHYLQERAPTERLHIWQQRLISPKANQRVIVAENGNTVMGFACVFLGEHPTWGSYLDNLHVLAPFQSQGVGSALLSQVLELCAQEPLNSGLCLLVNQSNHKAQQFYTKHGARNVQASQWQAPDGSNVPTYWFVWG